MMLTKYSLKTKTKDRKGKISKEKDQNQKTEKETETETERGHVLEIKREKEKEKDKEKKNTKNMISMTGMITTEEGIDDFKEFNHFLLTDQILKSMKNDFFYYNFAFELLFIH